MTSNQLMDQARCVACEIPQGMQLAVLISLMDQLRLSGNTAAEINLFTSDWQDISTGNPVLITVPHGLGATPNFVRCVLNNTVDVDGYAAMNNIEVDAHSWTDCNDAGLQVQQFTISADATNLYAAFSANAADSAAVYINDHGGGAASVVLFANWRMRFYAAIL